jgi:hypothetical protein
MRVHVFSTAVSVLAAITMAGCQSIGDPGELTSESLLKAAQSSPDAVTLDIYWARAELDDCKFADALWQGVQEDRIPVEVRHALAADGLRAGVVGGTPSEEIVRLLNPNGVDLAEVGDSTVPLTATPAKVTRRLRQLRPESRLEIQATDTPRTTPLLRSNPCGLSGRTFSDAQGIYAVQLVGRDADRAVLEVSPELHYGQPHMKYTQAGPGVVVKQMGRDVEQFDSLRMEVDLAPGEILVVTSLPASQTRLGGLFHHVESSEGGQQKYLLIRMSQVPDTPSLAASSDAAWPWK